MRAQLMRKRTINQYWCAYVTTILYAALLIAELAFLPETLYPREHVLEQEQSTTGADTAVEVKRTKQLGLFVSGSALM